MKNSLLRTFFEWALITSVLMSVGFFTWYLLTSRAVLHKNLQFQADQASLQSNRAIMSVLGTECQQYARTNADMQRLLMQLGAAASAPSSTTAPAKR